MKVFKQWAAPLVTVSCLIIAGATLLAVVPESSSGASGPTPATVKAWSQGNTVNVALAGPPNNFVPIDTTPTLGAGSYTYSFVINVSGVQPGAVVLCGEAQSISATVTGDYGVVDNSGGSAPIGGTCIQSGSIILTAPATMDFWATVYSGPVGSASVNKWSMTETRMPTPIKFTS